MTYNSIHFTSVNQIPYQYLFNIQNYQDQDQIPVDNEPQFHFDQNKNQFYGQVKRNTTTGNITTKITKTIVKGRPKKKQKLGKQEHEQILSEHVKTIFGLSLCYASKCLKKQCRKYSKYGFLHKNIAPNNYFYLEIQEAIKKNKIITSQYRNILQKEIKQNINLFKFLQKLLWFASNNIIDEILYIISHFIAQNHYIMIKYKKIQIAQTSEIQQIKQLVKKFVLAEIGGFQRKLIYLNFKCPRLKLSQETIQGITQHLVQFLQVLIVSTILSSYNFIQNPYFSIYYTYDQQEQKKKKIKKKTQKKKRIIIESSSQESEIEQSEEKDQKDQKEEEAVQIANYQQMQNSMELMQYNGNIQANYLMAFNYGYYNPYNRFYH